MPITSSASGVKAGTVAFFAANSTPPGWLKANGATISRAAYAALFAAIGTTYGAGDGATTFGLPDCRGEFLRCIDDGRGTEDVGRPFGSSQADTIRAHSHKQMVDPTGNTGGGLAPKGTTPAYTPHAPSISNIATQATGGVETRPRNIAMLACIKY